jgi:hypothetical protein
MKQKTYPPLAFFAILAYSLINSYELFVSWTNSPIEKHMWLAALLWMMPIPIYLMYNRDNAPIALGNMILALCAICLGLLSNLTAINAFAYCGLAASIAAFIPWTFGCIPWIVSSVVWMPGFGWYLSHQFEQIPIFLLSIMRVAIAGLGSLWLGYCYFVLSTKGDIDG